MLFYCPVFSGDCISAKHTVITAIVPCFTVTNDEKSIINTINNNMKVVIWPSFIYNLSYRLGY
ncbi:MAG: hypothetical protein JWR50_4153 [Mucilaginibacter sp.]|nr:hypothetical protein [Mucilaginibacter sp.]